MGKLCPGKVTKFWKSDENLHKSEIYWKVLVKFCLVTKIFPEEIFPDKIAFYSKGELNC